MKFDPRNPVVMPAPPWRTSPGLCIQMKLSEIWHTIGDIDLVTPRFDYTKDPEDHLYGWRLFHNGVEDISARRPSQFLGKKKTKRWWA